MPSIQEYQPGFTAARHVSSWGHDEQRQMYQPMDHRRSLGPTEILRPMEPTNVNNTPRQPLPARITGNESSQQRQQLPGLQELLSPSIRPGASSSFSSNWPSVNSNPSGQPSSNNSQLPHNGRPSQPGPVHFALTPPPFHRLSLDASSLDRFKQPVTTTPLGASLGQPSLPAPHAPLLPPPSRTLSELPGLRAPEQLPPPPLAQNVEHAVPHQPQTTSSFRDSFSDASAERRYSMAAASRSTSNASNYSLQCVGQRHIPGEGMCYVFKDGSTCPTIIDGEPVNPLWGTTKAGKARKRLAQACLNCREKKIKCEPGEKSCVQCEKAKRECHRGATQTQAELVTSAAALIVPNPPLGRAEWSSQSSSSAAMTDVQTQKRRRSAQVAQQDALNPPTNWGDDLSPQSPKRRRSDFSISSADEANERQRKDSKRVDLDDILASQPRIEARDPPSWNEDPDPYEIEPEGTIRFLELFFAQAAREVNLLFPRSAFTRWVRNCRDKSQRECMVLYALLALGSMFAGNEFSSFAKLCSERASRAVSRIDGQFNIALVQARLLVAAYHHLNGKESLGWDLSGSAIRIISAMRLNTEEGCGENSDELARCSYSFTPDQLRECRRRTFWTAFLVDRYHGFCGGLLCTIQSEDIRLGLPCSERIYEDGLPSDAPMFDTFDAFIRARSLASPYQYSPAAYTIVVASLWADVTKLIYRAPQLVRAWGGPPNYAMLVDEAQQKLHEWRNALPSHLKYNRGNLVEAIHDGHAGSLVSMHAIFHISQLKAARNTYNTVIPPQTVARHVRTAHTHALQLLEMVCDLRSTKSQGPGKGQDPVDLFSPFFAYGITAAIDTLSAGGLRADFGRTMEVLSGSVATLHDLARFCASANTQASQTSKRMTEIELRAAESFGATARDAYNKGNGDCWKITEQMEKDFPPQQDISYGISTAAYIAALREREPR